MSCVLTLKKMLTEVPDMSPSLRHALQRIVDGVFLELPEDDSVWRQARRELIGEIPSDIKMQLPWQKQVICIWADAATPRSTQ